MKKNILAENMLRFNAKNLSEKTKKEILRLVEQESVGRRNFSPSTFQTLNFGQRDWNIYSLNPKGILGVVSGTIALYISTANGEYVIGVRIAFPAGAKQALYSGELIKTSKAITGPDAIGSWTWRTPLTNNRPEIDSSKSYFSDGTKKVPVDKFMSMLSNDKNASAFVKNVLNPILGLK